jgi:hypothetical protein
MAQTYRQDGYVTDSIGPISIYQAILGIAGATGAAATLYHGQAAASSGSAAGALFSSPGAPAPSATPEAADSPDEP